MLVGTLAEYANGAGYAYGWVQANYDTSIAFHSKETGIGLQLGIFGGLILGLVGGLVYWTFSIRSENSTSRDSD